MISPFFGLLLQTGSPATPNLKDQTLIDLLLSSDPIVLATLGILILFSLFSWAIIFFKYFQIKRAQRTASRFSQEFERSETIDEAFTQARYREGNPLYRILASGISEILKNRQMQAKDPTRARPISFDRVKRNIDRANLNEISRLEQLVPFLATTASVTPFIGLFGTVWKILVAFWAIGKTGSTSLAVVGPYIALALIATAVGLVAAIPAVIAYNYFSSKIRGLIRVMESFSADLAHRIEKEYL